MIDKNGKSRKGMKVSRLAAALGACLVLPSASLHALGMGDIDIHSGLNQPLDASIRLISVAQDELDGLEVKLAPQAAFERMGIERLSVLSNLAFEVVEEDGRAPYVRVSSSIPVKEPFLDFILSVNWANGQMLREYTLLLDPPIFSEEEQPSAIEPVVSAPASISREEIRDFINAVEQDDPFGASYGPVKRNETLWAIAQEMRPNSFVSVPQMMLALLKENPEAFIDGNINSLKEGYILRAPQLSEINATSEQRAGIEASRQYQQWLAKKGASLGGGQRQIASDGAPVEQMPTVGSPVDTQAQPSARLQLVSPDDASFSGSEGGAEVATLQKQLALAVEAAEAGQQENAELQTRLRELEKQLADMQRLITLQDDTMTALQSGLAQGDELQKGEVSKTAEVVPPPGVEQSAVETTDPEVVTDVSREEAQAVPMVDTSEQPAVSSSSWTDPKVLAMAGGIFAVLLIVTLMIRKRRKVPDDEFFDSSALPIGAVGTAAAVTATDGVAEKADDASSKDAGLVGGVTEGEDYSTFGGAELGTIHAEESDIDPIAEADVYLAYRRYEQAEALLVDAIAGDDERQELKLKLLEIYFTTKDSEAFEAQAEVLYAALGGAGTESGLWAQAVEMGNELCPSHPLFSGSEIVDTSAVTDVVDPSEDGIASLSDSESLDFESLLEPEPAPVSEADSDFDLGVFSEDSEPALGVVSDEALAEFDLDLDIDHRFDSKTPSALDVDSFAATFDGESSGDGISTKDSSLGDELRDGLPEFELDSLEASGGVADIDPLDTNVADGGIPTENLGSFDDALEQPGSSNSLVDDQSVLDPEFTADLDKEPVEVSLDTEVNSSFDLGLDDLNSEAPRSEVALESEELVDEISELGFDLDLDHAEAEIDENTLASLPIDEVDELFTSDGIDQSIGEEFEIDLEFLENELDEKLDAGSAGKSAEKTDLNSTEPELGSLSEFSDLDNVVSFGGPDLSINDDAAFTEDLSDFDLDADLTAEAPFITENVSDTSDSAFADLNEEYSLFESADDVVGTKLDLAKAYIDMGDQDGARSILDEVVKEGSDTQKEEAAQLMQQMG